MKFTKKTVLLILIAVAMLIIGMGINPAEAHALGRVRPECKPADGYLFRDAHGNIICKLYKQPTVKKPKITARPVRQTRRTPVTKISRNRAVRSPLKTRITKPFKPKVYIRISQRGIRRQISHELESYDQDAEIARIREVQRKHHERRTKHLKD